MKNILITGVPGVGKTTLIKKLINHLSSQIELDGFLTEEIRNERFQRIGFSVRLIKTDDKTTLADKKNHPPSSDIKKLGQYTVYVKKFEDLTLQSLLLFDNGLLVIDEIGKMELFSRKFQEVITTVFNKKNIRILATVPIKGPPFVEKLKQNNECQLFNVTVENREQLFIEISNLLLKQK